VSGGVSERSVQPGSVHDEQEDPRQLDLFHGRRGPSGLDGALWSRRQSRHDCAVIQDVHAEDVLLVPLVLALARLSAQRDARIIGVGRPRSGTD